MAMQTYIVQWEIEIKADTPEEAACRALEIQCDVHSLASVFDVVNEEGKIDRVDIQEIKDRAFAEMYPHTKAAAEIRTRQS